jgi:hypothetical protein
MYPMMCLEARLSGRFTWRLALQSILAAFLMVALLPVPKAAAHETDQFTMPLDRPFADMGDWLDTVHYHALEHAAGQLNKEVTAAMAEKDPARREAEFRRIREPLHVAEVVEESFDDAFFEIVDVEYALREDWAKEAYPGQITIYRASPWIYFRSHFWIDPRQIVMQFQSSTLKAYGVYFGTDKLSHFHHMGSIYFRDYLARRAQGMSDAEALAWVVREYSSDGPIGEAGLLGFAATGVYANADLAANYSGMKFFMNLTQPVMLRGELRPPLLVHHGEFWRLNRHVRPESGWFGWYITDHWNEALNPSWFEWDIHDDVERAIRDRADNIVKFYTQIDNRPADPKYYTDLAHSLSTYYGEDYGHCQRWDRLITIADACGEQLRAQQLLTKMQGKIVAGP